MNQGDIVDVVLDCSKAVDHNLLSCGVSLGFILEHLLFLIYVNDF